jgi:hypothetical protein
MPIKKAGSDKPDISRAATPETLSLLAGQAELGPLDEKTALMIKMCEAAARVEHQDKLTGLQVQLTSLREQYKATLRELREKHVTLGFDDFLKILVGIVGGYLVREISGVGLEALKSPIVLFFILLLLVGGTFLVYRHCSNRGRKAEILTELSRLKDEGLV